MNKAKFTAALALLAGLLIARPVMAQTTGSYDTSVTFMGSPRAVSLYVPSGYSAAVAHRLMICLHGLGDTCNNYRNALVSSLGWPAALPNTILVCPEAANRYADYYYPAGGEDIVQASIDMAMAVYHIDTADVVLQGFSLGGRAALRYGLDNYATFRGLLLNTPAIQGVKEAINGGAYNFTYSNAPHIPVYITHGATDVLYTGPIDSMYEQMVLNDGVVRYTDFPGLGHAIPAFSGMADFHTFFDTPASPGYDLDIVKAMAPARLCNTAVPVSCLVRNTGDSTIHTINLSYGIPSGSLTHTWTGSLAPYQHAIITMPAITAIMGINTCSVSVTSLEAGVTDTFTANNTNTTPVLVQTIGTTIPYTQGFEVPAFPPPNWVAYPAGDIYAQWDRDDVVRKTGVASMYAFNTILIFDNAGRSDEIATPVFDLSAASNPHFTFDVSYNYHHYTPPTTTIDTVFADTLSVMVSTDCGDTYTTIYKKGGADLSTFAGPIMNPTTIPACYIDPTADQWRTEDIDLNAYKTYDKVLLKFSYKSALGGSINIDNVGLNEGGVGVKDISESGLVVYPNPARDVLYIGSNGETALEFSLTDMTGKTVLQRENTDNAHTLTMSTADLPTGIYLLRITTPSGISSSKVVINR